MVSGLGEQIESHTSPSPKSKGFFCSRKFNIQCMKVYVCSRGCPLLGELIGVGETLAQCG